MKKKLSYIALAVILIATAPIWIPYTYVMIGVVIGRFIMQVIEGKATGKL